MLKLKLQYFGHLMWRPWCWERLRARGEGAAEDEMVGWHLWLSMEIVKDRDAWCAVVHRVTQRWTWLRDWTTSSQHSAWYIKSACYYYSLFYEFNCSHLLLERWNGFPALLIHRKSRQILWYTKIADLQGLVLFSVPLEVADNSYMRKQKKKKKEQSKFKTEQCILLNVWFSLETKNRLT